MENFHWFLFTLTCLQEINKLGPCPSQMTKQDVFKNDNHVIKKTGHTMTTRSDNISRMTTWLTIHATTYMTIPDVYLDDYLAETRWPPRWQHMWHHQLRTNWKDRIYGLSSRSDVCICWHLVCHHGCHQGECCLLVWSHKFSSGLYTVVNIWLFFLVVIIDCCQLVLSCRQSSQLSPQGCYFENVILLSFGIVVI
jgi:hypothetical protein